MKTTFSLFLVGFLAFSGCRQAPEEPLGNVVTNPTNTAAGEDEQQLEQLRQELSRLDARLAELNQLNAKILALAQPLRVAYQARFLDLQPLAPLPNSFIGMLVGLDGKGTSYRLALIPNKAFRGLWHYSDALFPILRAREVEALQFEQINQDVHRFIELVQNCSKHANWIGGLAAKTTGSDPLLLQLKTALKEHFALEVLVELKETKERGLTPLNLGERKTLVVEEVQNLQLSTLAKAVLQEKETAVCSSGN